MQVDIAVNSVVIVKVKLKLRPLSFRDSDFWWQKTKLYTIDIIEILFWSCLGEVQVLRIWEATL